MSNLILKIKINKLIALLLVPVALVYYHGFADCKDLQSVVIKRYAGVSQLGRDRLDYKLIENSPLSSTQYDSLNSVASAVGSTPSTLVVSDAMRLTADCVVPPTLEIQIIEGGIITMGSNNLTVRGPLKVSGAINATTGVLAINGPFEGSLKPIFSGVQRIKFGTGTGVVIYPEWWGAVGDGVANDSASLQAVLNVWKDTPQCKLVFSPRRYKINTGLAVTLSSNDVKGKVIVGDGATLVSGLTTGWMLTLSSTAVVRNISISGLRFEGGSATETGCLLMDGGVSSQFLYGCYLSNITCDNIYNNGFRFTGNIFESNFYGLQARMTTYTGIGIEFRTDSTGIPSSNNLYGHLTYGGKYGVRVSSPVGDVNIHGGSSINSYKEGVLLENAFGSSISGLHVENCCQDGSSCAGLRVIGSAIITGVYGTSLDAAKQKYVVSVFASDSVIISSGASTGAIVKYANLAGSANGAVTMLGNQTYDSTYAFPVTIISGNRTITPINNTKVLHLVYHSVVIPVLNQGTFIIVSPITGNMTVANPIGTAVAGDEMTIQWVQDGGGGYDVKFGSAYKIVGAFASGFGTRTSITFLYNGSKWIQKSLSTGMPS